MQVPQHIGRSVDFSASDLRPAAPLGTSWRPAQTAGRAPFLATVDLRPYRPDDFLFLRRWIDSEHTLLMWGGPSFAYPLDELQWCRYLGGGAGPADQDIPAVFTAVRRGDGAPVGYGELYGFEARRGVVELTHLVVDPAWRGLGVGTEIVEQLLAMAFIGMGVVQVELGVFDCNQVAIACYQRLGFRFAGTFGEPLLIGAETVTLRAMVLQRGDWATHPVSRWQNQGDVLAAS